MQAETYQPPASESLMRILRAAMAGAHCLLLGMRVWREHRQFSCAVSQNKDKQHARSLQHKLWMPHDHAKSGSPQQGSATCLLRYLFSGTVAGGALHSTLPCLEEDVLDSRPECTKLGLHAYALCVIWVQQKAGLTKFQFLQ